MAHADLILTTAPDARVAEPHRSAVAGIVRATQQGLFTAAEAEVLIDRVRTHVTTFPLSNRDSPPVMGSEHASEAVPISPDRAIS